MRILVVSTPIFPFGDSGTPGYSGLEQIAWLQAKGLAARGHAVGLVAPDGSTCSGVQIIPCGPAGRVDEIAAWRGFPEQKDDKGNVLLRQHQGYWQAMLQFDVAVDHSWMKWSYSLKAEGVFKGPILGWFHAPVNTMYSVWPPQFPRFAPVEKACPVCISEDQAAHFRALHNRDCRVCYNGIDPEVYKPIPGVRRTDRFLFLGRFSTVKSPHLAIEACLKAGVGLDLVGDRQITGEPGYFEHCSKLAEQSSPGWDPARGRQIRVYPGCPRGEAVSWYSRAHAMIHPVRDFREPFGLAPVESQACGCPVIAWRNGAMPETVVDNRGKPETGSGVLVSSFDELVDVIRRAGRTNTSDAPMDYQRAFCRENALRFTVDRMVARCEELCEEALSTGGW